jgi:hypothetical protein
MADSEKIISQSVGLRDSQIKTILRHKEEGRFEGISDYIQQAIDFFENHRGVTKKDVLVYIIYPWVIASIFFIWSQDTGTNLQLHIALFYANFTIFGLVIASIYWVWVRYKKENM